jgi:hypothetical protein
MERMGYAVVNVGERDLRQGYDRFRETAGEREFEFVSANLVRQDSKAPIFKPHTVVEATAPRGEAKISVGIIGVTRFNPIFRKPGPDGSQLAIIHPVAPVQKAVAELEQAGVDLIVLLAALHRDDAARIVSAVPEIDFVVGSYGGHFTTRQDRVENSWLLYSGNQGKRLGETRVHVNDDRSLDQRTRMHILGKMYPSDMSMLDFVNSVPSTSESAVAAVGTGQTAGGLSGPYVGAETCKNCHAAEYAHWETTAHADALASVEQQLATHERGARMQCQTCHTTAAGLPGGFVSKDATPALASVGCESCHGAARRHLANPEGPYGKVGLSSCTVCHDVKNSPKFDYYIYLAKVIHQATR